MKPKKKDIQKWTDALRSGEYKQTKRTLQRESGFCCLGVACKLFIPIKKQRLEVHGGIKMLCGETPNRVAQPHAPRWLQDIDNDFFKRTGKALSALNDNTIHTYLELNPLPSLTFEEIADLLQAVYIEEVL